MTSHYKLRKTMYHYGENNPRNSKKYCLCCLLIIGVLFVFLGIGIITLYFVDEPVLAKAFQKMHIPYKNEAVTEANAYYTLGLPDPKDSVLPEGGKFVPVKVVPKRGSIIRRRENDLKISPEAYLLLKEPIKITPIKDTYPNIKGRLVLRTNNKKNSKDTNLSKFPLFHTRNDLLPSSQEYNLELDATQIQSAIENLAENNKDLRVSLSSLENLEDSAELDELADEILLELERELGPEKFLSQDGKSVVALPFNQEAESNDDSDNILVTPETFSFETQEPEQEEVTTVKWTDMNDTKDENNLEVAEEQLVNHSHENSDSYNASISKTEKPTVEVLETTETLDQASFDQIDNITFETNNTDVHNIENVSSDKEFLAMGEDDISTTTEAITTEATTEQDIITTTNVPIKVQTSTIFSTPSTSSVTTMTPTSTTKIFPNPLRKPKALQKKKNNMNSAFSLDGLTNEDIDILANFFQSIKNNKIKRKRSSSYKGRSNRRGTDYGRKIKRSFPENVWEKLVKLPRLNKIKTLEVKDITTQPNYDIQTTTVPEDNENTTHIMMTSTVEELPSSENSEHNNYFTKENALTNSKNDKQAVQTVSENESDNAQRIDVLQYDNTHNKRAIGSRLFPLITTERSTMFSNLKEKISPEPVSFMKSSHSYDKPEWLTRLQNEDSEERATRVEHDLQKMIKFVSVLSQLDGFLMDRAKSAARKVVTLLSEDEQDQQNSHRRRRRNYY